MVAGDKLLLPDVPERRMVDYRSIASDNDAFRQALSYAFSPASGPPDLESDEEMPPPAHVGDPRGVFEEGELVAACKHHWFDTRVRGEPMKMAGLSAVATPPAYRRRGYVRRLVEASLEEYRDRDIPITTLWPFEHAFYARMGWATANRHVILEGPPDALSFAREAVDGRDFVELHPDDHPRMADVLQTHADSYTLAITRDEAWWRKRVFQGWSEDPYVYGWEKHGELRAYLVYRVDENGDRLRVLDWAHVDHESRLALLTFLSNHDSQVETVRLMEPDPSLLDIVPDPAAFETRLHAGAMVRITDVETALASIPVPSGGDTVLHLHVTDPLVTWNDGTFEIVFGEQGMTVDRSSESPAIRLDIGTLSQLYVGYRGIDTLVETGDATVAGDDVSDVLRRVFPPTDVFLREGF